jgi:hypothetical protein
LSEWPRSDCRLLGGGFGASQLAKFTHFYPAMAVDKLPSIA